MKQNRSFLNMKLIFTIFIFLTSFTIKDLGQFVDKAYGTDEPAAAAALGGLMGAAREKIKKDKATEEANTDEPAAAAGARTPTYAELVKKIEEMSNKLKEAEAKIAELSGLKDHKCPAPAPDEEKKRGERKSAKTKRTLFGRVWSDFSNLYQDDLEGDFSNISELKDEIKEYVKEETSDFLDEEFSELDAASLLALDFGKTGIDRELKVLNRRIRELTRGGKRLERSIDTLESKKEKETDDNVAIEFGTEIEKKESELKSVAMEFYAAKRMKHEIVSQVEKRVKVVRDNFIAAQTQADQMKAYEEKMLGMAKLFQESDPMTRLLFLEMFPDLMQGDAQASPQGFSIDLGSTPGGGLRLGLGGQSGGQGFSLDFSRGSNDPFSQFFPNYTQNAGYGNAGYGNAGYGQFGNPFSVDPRQFGGSYWGQQY